MNRAPVQNLDILEVLRGRGKKVRKSSNQPYTKTNEVKQYLDQSKYQPYRETKGKYLHVSDLLSKCIRKIALYDKLGIKYPCDRVNSSMNVVHSVGHSLQSNVSDILNSKEDIELFGTWSCPCKKSIEIGIKKDVQKYSCNQCGGSIDNFSDLLVKDDDLRLVGAVDLPILKDGALILGECKSMTVKQWEGLTTSLGDHAIQIMLYWYLFNKKNKIKLHDKVFILYVRKEYQFSSPYKEFSFAPSKFDDTILDIYLNEAKQYAKYQKTKELPIRTVCGDAGCKKAMKCPLSEVCFSYD